MDPLSLVKNKREENMLVSNQIDFVGDLFRYIKEAHKRDVIDDSVPKTIEHEYLDPELRKYQMDAVRWMIHRERISEHLPTEYIPVHAKNDAANVYFLNTRTFTLAIDLPAPIRLPSGGILADEMGLGKTVEFLALIMLNRNPDFQANPTTEINNYPPAKKLKPSNHKILCLCNEHENVPQKSRSRKNDLIECPGCGFKQHRKCVLAYVRDPEDDELNDKRYLCPGCWKHKKPITSSATLIISPVAIKQQWMTEIEKHVSTTNFRVFIYDGIKTSGWICPEDLAAYDVVLTDYNVLQSDINFTLANPDRTMRHQKQFLHPGSPLPLVQWWRIGLDEAQKVESLTSMCSRMAKMLPAVNRWNVTGTPINNRLDNLYGLLLFLDCQPYDNQDEWYKLTNSYHTQNPKPLIDVLGKLMWRTCKADVLEQINIPPQTEIIHRIQMSDLESFFYMNQHEKYSNAFNANALRIQNISTVSQLDPSTLKRLMEPLLKIRQNCTIPKVHRGGLSRKKELGRKKETFSQSTELLMRLLEENETYGKNNLRTIASNLNGLAGLAIIRDDYSGAINLYKCVLRRARDHKDTNMTVDSLQQIHAIHNMLCVYETQSVEDNEIAEKLEEMKQSLADMEFKYINQFFLLVSIIIVN